MKKIFCFFCFLCTIPAIAQQSYDEPKPYDLMSQMDKTVNMPQSPEVAAFQKYGENSVDLYTGSPGVSVPIYNLSGNEMGVPISLSYDASGVKAEQVATNIGLGWNLNFGGVISRQVNQLPDDLFAVSTGAGSNYTPIWDSGYQTLIEYCYDNNVPALSYNHPTTQIARLRNLYKRHSDGTIDTQADTFSFNVNGLSGTIVVDYNETGTGIGKDNYVAYCLENPDIKVKLNSNLGSGTPLGVIFESWSIIDPNGTEYVFNTPEVTRNEYYADAIEFTREYYSAWHLTQIISPNGLDVFDFEYSSPAIWDNPIERNSRQMTYSTKKNNCISTLHTTTTQTPTYNRYKIYQFYLTKIWYNNLEVLTTQVGSSTRTDLPGANRISGLSIKDENGSLLLQVDFDNDHYFKETPTQISNNLNTRLKLEGVSFYRDDANDAKTYGFEYNNPTTVPRLNCNAIDYWGYFTNGQCDDDATAKPPSSVGWPFTPIGMDRAPDFNKTKIGSLQYITYPTGGRSEFFYEPHSGISLNNPDAINGVVGGLRIQKIVNEESIGNVSTTKYFYYNDLKAKVDDATHNLATLSPNIFNSVYESSAKAQQPLLFWEIKTTYDPSDGFVGTGAGASPHCNPIERYYQYANNIAAAAPKMVTYDYVTEIIFKGNDVEGFTFEGCTINEFHNNYYMGSAYAIEPKIDREVLNGSLKVKRVFDHQLKLLSETTSEYSHEVIDSPYTAYNGLYLYNNNQTAAVLGCLVDTPQGNGVSFLRFADQKFFGINNQGNLQGEWSCANVSGDPVEYDSYVNYSFNAYSLKYQWKKLERTITKTYEQNGTEMIDTVSYEYNSANHYFTTNIKSTDSKGNPSETEVSYPADVIGQGLYDSTEEAIYTDMVARNIIAGPLMAKQYYDGNLMSTQKKHYEVSFTANNYDVLRPKSIEVSKGTDALETRREYHSYDDYGNLTEVSNPDGTRTYYIWGYHGKQLLAEIKNKPSSSIPPGIQNLIDAVITDSNSETTQVSEDDLRADLNAIRSQAYFANSMVTTYTYDPGIGVTTVTDPKGYVMYYTYDQHNRLLEVRDADNNLVGANEYNYRIN